MLLDETTAPGAVVEADDGDNDDGHEETQRWRRTQPLDLVPRFVFGLTTGVSGNCLYLNDREIVYPAAGVIIVYDLESHSQRFIPLTGPQTVITAMDLNSINHMLAVATVSDEPKEEVESPIISVYDLRTLSLKQVFTEPSDNDDGTLEGDENDVTKSDYRSHGRRRFTKIQFLFNIFIAAFVVGGDDGSDCALYYYTWRNSKVDTSLQIDGPVADVALNPIDTTICCFVGKEFFRLMTRTEIDWTQYGFREAIGIDFTCVCWLDGDRCLAGTSDGRVVVLKNGMLQNSYRVDTIRDMDFTITTENDRLSVFTPSSDDGRQAEAVRVCFTFRYGFVLVVGDSDVYYFHKTDEGRRYVRNRVYQKREYWYLQAVKHEGEVPLHRVESACVSPNYERLTCLTRCGRLYWTPLDVTLKDDDDDDDDNHDRSFNSPVEINQLLINDFHFGGVESLSTCLWKPLLMTSGKIDCAVKLWDYTECQLLFTKQYSQQICSVSIHPTGLYSVVVFLDHVEFQMVQTEDLVPIKNFSIFDYSAVAFSSSGHMFALAKLDQIDVYSSLMLDKKFSCHGHLETITMMAWCNHDMNIVAYDKVGAISMFDTRNGKGMMHIAPYSGAAYTGLAVAEDVNKMFVITKDGFLKEVFDRKVVREVNFDQGSLNAISISKSDSTLFIAAQNGVILAVLLPMLVAVVQNKFKMQNKSIKKMCLTVDGSALITCSEDGSICIWEVKDYVKDEDVDSRIDIRTMHYDDVLVNLFELEKINDKIITTELVVSSLESECLYSIKELKKSKEQEIELKKISISHLYDFVEKHNKDVAVEHRAIIGELQNELVVLREKNKQAVAKLDAKYSVQLVNKYVKYLQLENKIIALTEELNTDFDKLQEKLNLELQKTVKSYEGNLKEKEIEILNSKNKLINTNKCLQKLVGDIEVDVDEYVHKVKHQLIVKLQNTKQLYLKSTADKVKYTMEYESFERSIKEMKQTADSLERDINLLKRSAVEKNDRINGLSSILAQYKDDIQQKDKETMDVRDNMRRLTTLQLTLKASIEDLEVAVQTLELEIQEKRNLIEQEETTFHNTENHIKRFKLYFTKLNETKVKVERDLNEKSKTLQDTLIAFKQMKDDLHEATKNYSNIVERHRKVTEFFSKYAGKDVIDKIEDEEFEAREEFFRQKLFIERRISQMKRMIELFENPKESHYLLLKENTRFLEEINVLRKDAKMYIRKYNNAIYALPLKGSEKNRTKV